MEPRAVGRIATWNARRCRCPRSSNAPNGSSACRRRTRRSSPGSRAAAGTRSKARALAAPTNRAFAPWSSASAKGGAPGWRAPRPAREASSTRRFARRWRWRARPRSARTGPGQRRRNRRRKPPTFTIPSSERSRRRPCRADSPRSPTSARRCAPPGPNRESRSPPRDARRDRSRRRRSRSKCAPAGARFRLRRRREPHARRPRLERASRARAAARGGGGFGGAAGRRRAGGAVLGDRGGAGRVAGT